MTTRIYRGPHLHHAVSCLRAGYPENAASWIRRDIGEVDDPSAYPSVESPKEVDQGIEYLTESQMTENIEGAGI